MTNLREHILKRSSPKKVTKISSTSTTEEVIDIDPTTGEIITLSSARREEGGELSVLKSPPLDDLMPPLDVTDIDIDIEANQTPVTPKRVGKTSSKNRKNPKKTTHKKGTTAHSSDQLPQAPPTKIEELYSSAQAFAEQAKSPQTKRAYQSDWNDFALWCQSRKFHPLPASPKCIALYLTERSETLKISSLRRRLTAISQVHKMRELEFNASHVAIRSVWAGIRRAKGTAAEGKSPVRVDDLRLIIFTRPQNLRGLRDIALISLGFSGAFRRSELVSLNHGDLEFVPEGLKVTLRRSKTDQEGAGMLKSVPYGQNPKTCCVRSVQRWLQASGIKSGPIFRPINRHGQLRPRRLTGHAVAVLLKEALAESLRSQGIPEAQISEKVATFSGHSLRAGYVTSAAAEGAEEHVIMRQTGHKRVDTVRRYIREGDAFRNHPLEKMGI